MPRPLRIEFPGAVYHLTSRANRGEAIFRAAEDCEHFLAELGEACGKTGWRVHAYCLMPDHLHLVLETPAPNLVRGMKWLLGTFTHRYNRRHGTHGHLFAGRYHAVLLEPHGPWFRLACEHVLLNPARAGVLTADQPLAAYPWSSLGACLRPPTERPSWLATDRLREACGLPGDSEDDRRRLASWLEARRAAAPPPEWRKLRRGWCLGGPEFRHAVLERLRVTQDAHRRGVLPPDAQELLGRRIIAEELARRGWSEAELPSRRKTDPEKLAIAQRLRRETALSLRWIASVLHLGSVNTLRNALQAARSGTRPAAAPEPSPAAPATPLPSVAAPFHPAGTAADDSTFSVAWD